jgi:hypothetical protein
VGNGQGPPCDHGLAFDALEAERILACHEPAGDASLIGFLWPEKAYEEIRHRWPRLEGKCPKGCGFEGIAYASEDHYLYGDWVGAATQ